MNDIATALEGFIDEIKDVFDIVINYLLEVFGLIESDPNYDKES